MKNRHKQHEKDTPFFCFMLTAVNINLHTGTNIFPQYPSLKGFVLQGYSTMLTLFSLLRMKESTIF